MLSIEETIIPLANFKTNIVIYTIFIIAMKPIKKQVEIKQGFFPSFVYLQPTQTIKKEPYVIKIRDILIESNVKFRDVQELHLSLSRTFYPIYTEIQTIVNQCKAAIRCKKINLPVVLLFKQVQILENFITIQVQNITAERLAPITKEVQKIVKESYYEKPVFHVSLFKVQSEISPDTLAKILEVQIEPKKSYVLSKCLMKSGKVTYELNA